MAKKKPIKKEKTKPSIFKESSEKLKEGFKNLTKTLDKGVKNLKHQLSPKDKKRQEAEDQTKLINKAVKKGIKRGTKPLKKSVSELKTGQTQLISGQDDIKEDLAEIKSYFIEIFDGISKIQSDLSQLREENANRFQKIIMFEKGLRVFLREKLKEYYDDKWWEAGIPEKTRNMISKRIQKKDLDSYDDYMNYMCFGNYRFIIENRSNWLNIFEKIFPDKDSVLKPLNELRKIRNELAHGNEDFENVSKTDDFLIKLNNFLNN